MRRFYITALSVFAADRLTKALVIRSDALHHPLELIPNIFHLTLVMNRGMAFGLLRGGKVAFILFAIAASACIIRYVTRSPNVSGCGQVSLGLMLGGTIGNLVDRIRFGYVVDFL
ncbi:MAG: signal peptidase II, partial [Candidatus Omnitrophota bacterium]